MTTTCPQPAADLAPADDPQLDAERPAGELLALVTLDPAPLRAWTQRPELPIPGRTPR